MQLDKATISHFSTDPKALTTWQRKGSGAFSTVRKSTIEGMVVKTSNCLYSDAWVAFAASVICLKDKRPGYLPRIEALVVDPRAGTYFAIMEELKKGPRSLAFWMCGVADADRDVAQAVRSLRRSIRKVVEDTSRSTSARKAAASIPERLPGFTRLIRTMMPLAPRSANGLPVYLDADMHSGNGMIREATGEYVFSDPFVWENWYVNKRRKTVPGVIEGLKALQRRSGGRIIFI